jgi:hypothetical protein
MHLEWYLEKLLPQLKSFLKEHPNADVPEIEGYIAELAEETAPLSANELAETLMDNPTLFVVRNEGGVNAMRLVREALVIEITRALDAEAFVYEEYADVK